MRSISRRSASLLSVLALVATSCAQLQNLPTLTDEDVAGIKLAQSSKVYAADRSLITSLHGAENRTIVPLERISDRLIDAVIAIEDARFWEHDGVDYRAIGRALVSNISSGGIREGGSTITQQYVKNSIISPGETAERTIERKINEAALARQLEKRLDKEVILERYLNTVYFGAGAYGVQAAAKTYFGKPARKVNLKEGALLAGLIRAPADYDPFLDKQAALDRRSVVLDRMVDLDYVDEIQAAKAKGQKIGLRPRDEISRYPAPYFMDYVQRLITYDPRFEAIGETPAQREQQLFQGGLRIYTTLDMEAQAAAEQAIAEVLTSEGDPHASMVAIDPQTGEVRAMVGGRDWFAKKKEDPFAKLNLAIQGEPDLGCQRNGKGRCKTPFEPGPAPGTGRHAGSAFKPFALAQAIREGVPLGKVYEGPSCINLVVPETNEAWRPCNYESGAYGKISLLEATTRSVNTVFAQLILEVGGPDTVELADELGINTPLFGNPSSVLGTNEVNPLGMTSAYATLASGGEHHPPVAVKRIVAPGGKVLYEDDTKSEQVVDPAVAFLTTKALETVIQRGTGVRAAIGRPAAGKTGTAQEYRDAWFAGYTPDLAAAVWVGYPEGQIEMKTSCSGATSACRPTRIQVSGGTWPTEIWAKFMSRALAGVPASSFINPGVNLVTVTIDDRTGCLADRFTPKENRVSAEFLKSEAPEESCRVKGDRIKVPDVFGFPAGDAARILTDEGFEVEQVRERSTSYPPGRVIGQDPEGGSKAPAGSTIVLTVSATGGGGGGGGGGEDCTAVPNVLGMKQGDAQSELNDAGFQVTTIYQKESDKKQAKKRKDRVWKQSPSSGSCVDEGSKVTIWVNP